MNIEAITSSGSTGTRLSSSQEVSSQRKNAEKGTDLEPQAASAENKVQPEELLNQIKALTQDGLYSVRFETNESSELVVQIFDNESKEVIRQIPPEDLLNFKATFNELLGNIVNTKG